MPNKRQAYLYSGLWGFLHFLVSLGWVGYVSRLGLFLLCSYLSLYWFLFFAGLRFILRRISLFRLLGASWWWVILECLRGVVLGGFGWNALGYSQYKMLYLVQSADLFGVEFISFLIISFNLSLFLIFKERRVRLFHILVVFLLVFSWGYSSLKMNLQIPKTKHIELSLMQPSILQEDKWNPLKASQIVEVYAQMLKETSPQSLVIFPEASWPYLVQENDFSRLKRFSQQAQRYVLWGFLKRQASHFYNEAGLFSPRGHILEEYKKVKLVPFGEYVPLRRLLGFVNVLNQIGDISPGKEYTVFDYRNRRFAVLICFEDLFPSLCFNFLKRDIDFFVNITNDAWFRGNPQAQQHLSLSVFRAIETGRSFLRVANTGITTIISSRGKILTKPLPLFKRGVLEKDIYLEKINTFYPWGKPIFLGLGFLFLGSLFFTRRKEYGDAEG